MWQYESGESAAGEGKREGSAAATSAGNGDGRHDWAGITRFSDAPFFLSKLPGQHGGISETGGHSRHQERPPQVNVGIPPFTCFSDGSFSVCKVSRLKTSFLAFLFTDRSPFFVPMVALPDL